MEQTPLEALIAALADAAACNPAVEAPPEALLWCDGGREFLPLLPLLRARLPQLLTYGAIDETSRTGPAVWLRAAVGRALAGLALPAEAVPIVYLPGIGREALKAAENCPKQLEPLAWLGVAGKFFGQVNGKDWTLRGFLAAERGRLRLNVPEDAATRAALADAAALLFTAPLEQLRGRQLDAAALHALLVKDLPALMLEWMEHGGVAEAEPERFHAFAARARRELGFDPAKEAASDAAARMAGRKDGWEEVWQRFAEAPLGRHRVILRLLHACEPPADLLADFSPYPGMNERREDSLRAALEALGELAPDAARARLAALEREHGWRRETVWAKGGLSPLAMALGHLAHLAAAPAPPAGDAAALAAAYAALGWQADWAALQALAAAPRDADRAAVAAALHAVYLPWLEAGASALQALARAGKVPFAQAAETEAGTLLFIDGLRMDLGQALLLRLRAAGAEAEISWVWSGFPTITATCKPLVSPAAKLLHGGAASESLLPVGPSGKDATKPVLFKLLAEAGWETEGCLLAGEKNWIEAGRFDAEGHALGARMAERVADGLEDVAARVLKLARSGQRVRVVTDHGWLLMPGGLPRAPLDPGLVEPEGKRSRCARLAPDATSGYAQLPWSWNPAVRIAIASGARAFLAGQEYAHGGVSPQECILPVIEVKPLKQKRRITIRSVAWHGLRLRVEVAGGADLSVDLRRGAGTAGPSIAKGTPVLDETGKTSLLVSDEFAGEECTLVVLGDDGAVVARRGLKVGTDAA